MSRRIAAQAEVAGGADQADAEVILPGAVHRHARRQRIGRIDDCLRQFQPAAAAREWLCIRSEGREEPARHRVTRPVRIPAHEHARIVGRTIEQHHRPRRCGRTVDQPLFDFFQHLLILPLRSPVRQQRQEAPAEHQRHIGRRGLAVQFEPQFLFVGVVEACRRRPLQDHRVAQQRLPLHVDRLQQRSVSIGRFRQ